MEEEKYFLSQDCSSHWYVVPIKNKKEWDEWCEIDEDDERAWEAPDFAEEVWWCPWNVEFTSYKIK